MRNQSEWALCDFRLADQDNDSGGPAPAQRPKNIDTGNLHYGINAEPDHAENPERVNRNDERIVARLMKNYHLSQILIAANGPFDMTFASPNQDNDYGWSSE